MATDRSPLRVVGRYALYNEIAAGGMATVHIGRLLGPVGFARTVAVKRLHPQFAKDPEFVSMFLDEARLAARVQHPNVVATIDVVATDGELFLIMDYVRGESLSRLLRQMRKQDEHVSPRIAAAIMCGFLHGLHSAHEAKSERGEPLGLVHRDVSPQNVLVGADGIARVLDFGIAKAQGRIQVTRDGQIKGKLAYMPPEQLSGRELTRAVDIYASAVVMWETLTGERLFKGDTEGETLHKILRDPVLAPSAVNPKVPKSFDGPLLRALSREAKQRHATARELALELERCVGIASPTEVGEWVENAVGSILSAREDQISAIESNSAALRVSQSGRPVPESPSDSDISGLPFSPAGTIVGLGPTSGTHERDRQSQRNLARMTPTLPMTPSFNEGTGSKLTGSQLMLPVDRRLPILATVAGLIVLFVAVGIVLAGRFSDDASAKVREPAAGGMVAPPPRLPVPEPAAAPSPVSTLPAPEEPRPEVKPPPQPQRPVVAKPAPPPPPPQPKKNCDPNYWIDEKGHKRYKIECM
jgi:serine/threonine-protein kinase